MKIDKEKKAFLRSDFKEYVKTHPMSTDEYKALLKWINKGNSVYDNSMMAVGYDYLTEYRDAEYIRNATEDMSQEDAQRFAWNYYGWDFDSQESSSNALSLEDELIKLEC